ncbi:TetR/AcrR family transcriptional regulator [Brevibacterium sp. 91QC2O2]|uniref:TetR/AcrR family transcriptional regulator n=1 Tax=Brevibacterium TaxID=1696 RepID=UPI00211C8230|nr:TetR/AcrR family transcriptional regulator [Brevibacterium sp. 91QC2O2]MCQ9386452.1 TetR/AcrR family transcriptional regulator [Brevibacterium sp. 68QC2CO]
MSEQSRDAGTAPRTRRRGTELEDAIHEAVLAELREHGYAGVGFAGVAKRARTSRPVLARRYASRAQMVAAAFTSNFEPPEPGGAGPAAATLRTELIDLFTAISAPSRRLGPQTSRALLGEADQELLDELMAGLPGDAELATRVESFLRDITTAARARGELGPRDIPAHVLTAPLAVLRFAVLEREVDDAELARIVDDIAIPLYRVTAQG